MTGDYTFVVAAGKGPTLKSVDDREPRAFEVEKTYLNRGGEASFLKQQAVIINFKKSILENENEYRYC